MHSFPYFYKSDAQAELMLDDIGNCAFKGFSGEDEYICIVETHLGNSRLFTFGPIKPDFETLPPTCECCIKTFEFNPLFIAKEIKKFLVPRRKLPITQAFECTKEEALRDCRDLVGIMNENF